MGWCSNSTSMVLYFLLDECLTPGAVLQRVDSLRDALIHKTSIPDSNRNGILLSSGVWCLFSLARCLNLPLSDHSMRTLQVGTIEVNKPLRPCQIWPSDPDIHEKCRKSWQGFHLVDGGYPTLRFLPEISGALCGCAFPLKINCSLNCEINSTIRTWCCF